MTTNTRTNTRRPAKKPVDTSELKAFLASLNLPYTVGVHVNGPAHPNVLFTVDFGSPLESTRLNGEQQAALSDHIRIVGKRVFGKDVPIRVSNDLPNGVWWASV